MEKMFEIPVDYWESYLNVDEENIYPNQYNTPQTPDGASKYLIYIYSTTLHKPLTAQM